MKYLIKKILKESDWDWVDYGGTEITLKDYLSVKNITLHSEWRDPNDDLRGLNVRISENSRFYDEDDESNPINDIGKIHWVNPYEDDLPISVYWPSYNDTNTYDIHDLIVV